MYAPLLTHHFPRRRLPDEAEPPAFLPDAELAEFERRATLARAKVCPSCRATVVGRPVEVWMIKGMLEKLEDAHRAGHGEGGEEAAARSPDEIKAHRQEDLAQGAALWKGELTSQADYMRVNADPPRCRFATDIFKEKGYKPRIVHDIEDAVDRCGECANEIVDGECQGW